MNRQAKAMAAAKVLDQQFLDMRSRLLDLAASLDRIGRGDGSPQVSRDPRLAKIHQALDILNNASPAKAEQIQKLFSLEYDPSWEIPKPRY